MATGQVRKDPSFAFIFRAYTLDAQSTSLKYAINFPDDTPGLDHLLPGGGTLTTLYTFCARSQCMDGDSPSAGLVLATDGNFYGTTSFGGNQSRSGGLGTVFKLTPTGRLRTLHRFCSRYPHCPDGLIPTAGLVQGAEGNFYGTAAYGGRALCDVDGCGTVFRITSDGTFTTLHSFDLKDGAHPHLALLRAVDGNFYGTTQVGGASVSGGTSLCYVGCGTVFKMTRGGQLTTLDNFCAQSGSDTCADGAYPSALTQSADETFYGTTSIGGLISDACPAGCGTVYKTTGPGMLTPLHIFDKIDGAGPGTLIQATDGNFYGVASYGGETGNGTLFTITPDGNLRTLHTFCPHEGNGCPDGQFPSGLFQATDGKFYGSTQQGGASGAGTLFSLDTGVGPFISFVNRFAKVGGTVGILGQKFTGTSNVSFNGTSAPFTVKSETFIDATVPAGAMSGYVTVTTPSGALTSNVSFRVIP